MLRFFFSLLLCGVALCGWGRADEYDMNRAKSLIADAEYQQRQAAGYLREAEYYKRQAAGHEREADYYRRQRKPDREADYRRKAEQARRRAEEELRKMDRVNSNAADYLRSAARYLER